MSAIIDELEELSKSNIVYSVIYFQRGHSILELELYDSDRKTFQYFIFEGVIYFDGATQEKVKRFYLDEAKTCLKIIRTLSVFDSLPDDYLENKYKMFVISCERILTIIIALGGTLTEKSFSGKGVIEN